MGEGKILSLKDTSMGVTSSSTDEGNGYSSKIISCAPICAPRPENSNDTTANVVIKNPATMHASLWRRSEEIDSLSRQSCFLIALGFVKTEILRVARLCENTVHGSTRLTTNGVVSLEIEYFIRSP